MADSLSSATDDEKVTEQIAGLVAEKTKTLALPKAITDFLTEAMLPLLATEASSSGFLSPLYGLKMKLLEDLLLTMQVDDYYRDRVHLSGLVSEILPQLGNALFAAGFDRKQIAAWLLALEHYHKSRIVALTDNTLQALAGQMQQDEDVRRKKEAGKWVGTWFERLAGEKKERGQLAAYIRHKDQYVVTSVSGEKAHEISSKTFQRLLAIKEIRLLESDSHFAFTLETVIDGMRNSKQNVHE